MPAPSPLTMRFLQRLAAAPGSEPLPWSQWAPATFALQGQSGTVIVSNEGDGDHPYSLRILDPQGELLDAMTTIPDVNYLSWERQLEALYASAREAALHLPAILESLADEYGLPDEVEEPAPTNFQPSDSDIPF